jgi:FkbH-like protein
MIGNKVKLVVWDLDDTFWRGTLTEGGITPIPENGARVMELARRGILNSICSKNDAAAARAKLEELGVWDYFVFPTIGFNPKGKAVAEMIEGAALRPENVLFIDDNPSNLEEVKFFNPGIMTAHPDAVLAGLLAHPHCAGKPDPELTRLKQYRFLQKKVEEKSASALSNEEFLRASNIRLTLDYDIEANLDRVLELINRTNQLNYTKQRVNTPEELAEFRELMDRSFSYHAACVRAVDNYGDYGLVGFYLMQRRATVKRLVHFVFSCRTMNMGIEQYIYEMLGKPDIEIAPPVSYGLDNHTAIDWIKLGSEGGEDGASASARKLVLLGGCDLLQLASYCSSERLEFVNGEQDGMKVRFDDPSFVLSDREAIRQCETIRKFSCWRYEDALRFDQGLASAEIALLSLWPGMNGKYFNVGEGVRVRLTKPLAKRVAKKDPAWFARNFHEEDLDDKARLKLIFESFDSIAATTNGRCRIYALGCYTMGELAEKQVTRRRAYNKACREYCEAHSRLFRYVDADAIVPVDTLVDKIHFSRAGYFALAKNILAAFDDPGATAEPLRPAAE